MSKLKLATKNGLLFAAALFLLFLTVSKLESVNFFLSLNLKLQNLAIVFQYERLVNFFKAVTFLGQWQFLLILGILLIFFLWTFKKRFYIFPILVSLIGAQINSSLLKNILDKPRSLDALVLEQSFSFPSGHAIMSIVFYGIIVFLLFKLFKSKKIKVLFLVLGFLLIFSIDFSRIYLRVHFFSDVLGGFLLGLVWLVLAITWMKSLYLNKVFFPVLAGLIIFTSSLFFFTLPTPKSAIALNQIVAENPIVAFNEQKLPKFTEKLSSKTQQPLSFFILAKDDKHLISVFDQAGWLTADRFNYQVLLKSIEAAKENKSYPTAPITPSLWFNKVQDFGFQEPTPLDTVHERHHGRIWKTNIKTTDGRTLYVGTASYDYEIKWYITHSIDSDIDKEREYLYNDLLETGRVEKFEKINLVGPIKGRNFIRDPFFTDGKAYVIYFK